MRISSPGTQILPGNSAFQRFKKKSPLFLLISRKRRRHAFEGTKIIIPGWSMYYIQHKNRFVQACEQSFSVVLTIRTLHLVRTQQQYSSCCVFFFLSHFYFPACGQAVVSGVVPFLPPRYVPSVLIAHRVQHSHCASTFIECCEYLLRT